MPEPRSLPSSFKYEARSGNLRSQDYWPNVHRSGAGCVCARSFTKVVTIGMPISRACHIRAPGVRQHHHHDLSGLGRQLDSDREAEFPNMSPTSTPGRSETRQGRAEVAEAEGDDHCVLQRSSMVQERKVESIPPSIQPGQPLFLAHARRIHVQPGVLHSRCRYRGRQERLDRFGLNGQPRSPVPERHNAGVCCEPLLPLRLHEHASWARPSRITSGLETWSTA